MPNSESGCYFYPPEYYVFDNFSSFAVEIDSVLYPTSEHAYHCLKFSDKPDIAEEIRMSRSAHDALRLSQKYANEVAPDWTDNKVAVMKQILLEKVNQHEYVMKKLLDSGDREIVEDSWRDSFWGWGEDQKGDNKLGRLWMEIRSEMLNLGTKTN